MIVLPQLVVSSIAELWINSILFYFIFILSAIYISFLSISVNSFRIQNVHRGEIVELFFSQTQTAMPLLFSRIHR